MRFMQLLRILRAHMGLIILTVVVAWSVAAVVTAAATPRYVASSSLLVNFADQGAVTAKPPIQLYSGYLATQVDVLTSQSVLLRVVDELRLVEDPKARAAFLGRDSPAVELLARVKARIQSFLDDVMGKEHSNDSDEPGDERYRLSDQLLKRVTIRPAADSSVIQVNYSAPTPQAAAIAANAIAKAYIDTTLELNVKSARGSSEWLDAQVRRLETEAQAARSKLAEFQQRTGIVSSDAATDSDTARLNDLNAQLVAAQSQNHPAIQALKGDLARAQAKLNELPPQMGPNHPTYRAAQREVAALRAQMETDSERIAENLRSEIARQRGSMLTMKRHQGELAALQETVKSAQAALDDAIQKGSQAQMDSQVTQTNVSVISVAVPPRHATTPNPLFNFSLATLAGIFLGAGLGLWREVVCRFVRSADDIRDFLGVQVLGVLHEGPRSSSGRARLLTAPLMER